EQAIEPIEASLVRMISRRITQVVDDRKRGMKPALFDLGKDIGEATDLSGTEGERLKAMLKKLDQWESEMEEPRWGPGKIGK
ncbi:hypothetical protein N8511_02830, partial [Akkermansiaceae bacterium]|nr:hypothetical protein [Akkermansiaceae bacterium]